MGKKKVGLIRVMTLEQDKCASLESRLENIFPELAILAKCIPDQPEGVFDGNSYLKAEPKVVKVALELENEGASGIMVNCAADPGVKRAREFLKIPIIGAGSASALLTKSMGLPVGIIGVFNERLIAVEDILGSLLIASVKPERVLTARDFANDEVFASIKKSAVMLKEKGAKCILITCTAMSLLGIAPALNQQLEIPVIDPLMASMEALNRIVTCKPYLK